MLCAYEGCPNKSGERYYCEACALRRKKYRPPRRMQVVGAP